MGDYVKLDCPAAHIYILKWIYSSMATSGVRIRRVTKKCKRRNRKVWHRHSAGRSC